MNKIRYISMIILSFLLFNSCEEDPYSVIDQQRIHPEAEMQYPNNPETGLPYTADELLELDFNPLKEGFYYKDQPVELKVRTTSKPSSVFLIIGEDTDGNREELTEISGEAGNYTISLNSTVQEIGVEQGKTLGIAFEIHYASSNTRGLVKEHVTYKISRYMDPREFNTYEFFKGQVNTFATTADGIKLDQSSDDLSFRYDNDFTVSIWLNTTASNSDPSIISDKDWGYGGNAGFIFAYIGYNWKLNLGDGAGNRVDLSGPAVNDGKWHLLTATFDRDGDVVIYQDMVEIARKDMSSFGSMDSGLPIYIGQDGTGKYSKPYMGKTREVYFHDVALTKSEIEKFYQ
ncbi:MAG: LamG domain-containing protein [Marinilabiliaceae bacterium]|nr:LamG domain-containing protein [Marinilabiliaceae bacterium]